MQNKLVNPTGVNQCASRLSRMRLGLLFALTAIVGCSREHAHHTVIAIQPGATNGFVIHMQEGFYQGLEAVITVDGREVYRGRPKTRAVLGFAEQVSVTTTSANPVVTFTMPGKSVAWSKKIDLSAGPALGFSVTEDGKVAFIQSPGFGYD